MKSYICPICESEFQRYSSNVSTDNPCCSKECLGKKQRDRVELTCEMCGDVFEKTPGSLKQTKHRYCSNTCKFKGMEDKITLSCNNCGDTIHKQPNEVKKSENQYCSISCRSQWYCGDRSPLWKENESDWPTLSDRQWRRAIFERDGFECQDCGDDTGGNLVAHHIKHRSECSQFEKYAIWNGVTLCQECHAERHEGEDVYEMLKWIAEQ